MEAILQKGLTALNLPTENIPALLTYASMLAEKNKVMNLTAITDPANVARLHFLDSAALLTLADFHSKSVIDVGTGAGFPGLPLRILDPSIHLTLLDAQNKRIEFLREVCAALNLEDISCIHARAEEHAASHRAAYDIAVSRAVASLPVLAELCLPLVKKGGLFLAMKSTDSGEEVKSAARAVKLLGAEVQNVLDYPIPGTEITHRLVILYKISATPEKYPRTFAKIKKNPL
ncbi:MAG: 16S rRNA (guanine(527)-N(7))-methyltransferase RsmG [Oscillibacter sp.]|nr:16S rRNA (guanine(527)-N(7))-methyltransferase RsmG [Oscillibacter sp.]